MAETDPLSAEYNKFMKWFEENHPSAFNKYDRNISIPLELGGGVTVNNNYRISDDEFIELRKIAHSYYHPNEEYPSTP